MDSKVVEYDEQENLSVYSDDRDQQFDGKLLNSSNQKEIEKTRSHSVAEVSMSPNMTHR